jgi:hypothetical protein
VITFIFDVTSFIDCSFFVALVTVISPRSIASAKIEVESMAHASDSFIVLFISIPVRAEKYLSAIFYMFDCFERIIYEAGGEAIFIVSGLPLRVETEVLSAATFCKDTYA